MYYLRMMCLWTPLFFILYAMDTAANVYCMLYTPYEVIKPGACLHGFLKLISCRCLYVCVCVCVCLSVCVSVSAPGLLKTIHVK